MPTQDRALESVMSFTGTSEDSNGLASSGGQLLSLGEVAFRKYFFSLFREIQARDKGN